jgi:hypothetical protein
MINSQDMQWVIDLFEELEKGYVDRVAWHYTEGKKIVQRMKLIIEQTKVAEND